MPRDLHYLPRGIDRTLEVVRPVVKWQTNHQKNRQGCVNTSQTIHSRDLIITSQLLRQQAWVNKLEPREPNR